MTNTIRFINETQAQVTKEFMRKASIFGTEEFELWYAYKNRFPKAIMTTKKIKKNASKRTNKNMKYEYMVAYIKTKDNSEELMVQFKTVYEQSKIQSNPYRSVLAWFLKTFPNYDEYKDYFAALAKEEKEKKNLFNTNTANDNSNIEENENEETEPQELVKVVNQ